MNRSNKEIQPKDLYRVNQRTPLSQEGEQALLYLYQPIIGSDALALYFNLVGDALSGQEYTHLDILNGINLGLQPFLAARYKLEGLGLLKTYQEDLELGPMLTYELLAPLNPQAFLAEQLLAHLLLSQVGQRKFDQLVARFSPKIQDYQGLQEITKKFSEVYQWSNQAFGRHQAMLEQAAQQFATTKQTAITVDNPPLDWALLVELAQNKFVDPAVFTAEFKEQIRLFQSLYGYNEMQLAEALGQIVTLDNGQVNAKDLENLLMNQNKVIPDKKISSPVQTNQNRRFNTLRQAGYSDSDIQMIQQAEELAPMEYLVAIKQAKGSFVSKNEEWLVKDLVNLSPLSNSVINVLLNYVLVLLKKSSLVPALVNQIATDWSEKSFKTPEEAIKHVRQLREESAKPTSTKPRYQSQKGFQKQEELPDWSQKTSASNPARQAEINRMMAEYFSEEGEK
ncbi:MAG: DnaD domain protein [Enterococcus sp.]